MPRKYLVRCDLEGATGVVGREQVDPRHPEYAAGRRLFMGDLLALMDGLSEAGVEEILLYDAHAHGRNIDVEQLPDFARAILGRPPYRADWPGGLDPSFSGLILLGAHARAGAPGGLLAHIYGGQIAELRLNGVPVGEIGLEAAVAGDAEVPLVLVVGGLAACNEARALLPAMRCVAVKESLGQESALCYAPAASARRISRAAAQAARSVPPVEPYRMPAPVRLEVDLRPGPLAEALGRTAPEILSEPNTAVLVAESTTAAWAAWLEAAGKARAAIPTPP